jgi:hypothetical protein
MSFNHIADFKTRKLQSQKKKPWSQMPSPQTASCLTLLSNHGPLDYLWWSLALTFGFRALKSSYCQYCRVLVLRQFQWPSRVQASWANLIAKTNNSNRYSIESGEVWHSRSDFELWSQAIVSTVGYWFYGNSNGLLQYWQVRLINSKNQ